METGTCDFIIEHGVLKKYTGSDETVAIPDGVRKIDKAAFEDCDRTRLTICAAAGSYAEEFAMEYKYSFFSY